MDKIFKISIVIPIYNTEKYLQETINCIIYQTIGFLDNIQLILVDDYSTDNSQILCENYQSMYPENIKYIRLEKNCGVSAARNVGLTMAKGKYITFLDSDDLWSLNAMEKAIQFLEDHEAEIDMVSANIEFFDGWCQSHVCNIELEKSRIIDIHMEYKKIRSNGPVAVIKTEIAKKYCFDESQSCWEDTKYINQIILRKQKYGMLADVKYYYRRRKSQNSASQLYTKNKNYYLHDLMSFYKGIYDESMKQCGQYVPMVQYLLAYALAYRFAEPITILNESEQKQYDNIRKEILDHIEDKYLQEVTNVDFLSKWKMLAFKYDLNVQEEIEKCQKKNQDIHWLCERIERISKNYHTLRKWFELKQDNKNIALYFQKNGYYTIAIYGMSDLGVYLWKELENSGVQVLYGIDRRAEQLKINLPVLQIEDNLPEVDIIIVTAVYFFNMIDDALRKKVNCSVLSLEDVLYSVE